MLVGGVEGLGGEFEPVFFEVGVGGKGGEEVEHGVAA